MRPNVRPEIPFDEMGADPEGKARAAIAGRLAEMLRKASALYMDTDDPRSSADYIAEYLAANCVSIHAPECELPFGHAGECRAHIAPPGAEATIAWVKKTYATDHVGAALFGIGRIAEALENISRRLEWDSASKAGL